MPLKRRSVPSLGADRREEERHGIESLLSRRQQWTGRPASLPSLRIHPSLPPPLPHLSSFSERLNNSFYYSLLFARHPALQISNARGRQLLEPQQITQMPVPVVAKGKWQLSCRTGVERLSAPRIFIVSPCKAAVPGYVTPPASSLFHTRLAIYLLEISQQVILVFLILTCCYNENASG